MPLADCDEVFCAQALRPRAIVDRSARGNTGAASRAGDSTRHSTVTLTSLQRWMITVPLPDCDEVFCAQPGRARSYGVRQYRRGQQEPKEGALTLVV